MTRGAGPARLGDRLSDGMTIVAHVRARVLGMKLLELDADVVVAPAGRTIEPRARNAPALVRGGNGRIGSHMGDVADTLDRGEVELEEARRSTERLRPGVLGT